MLNNYKLGIEIKDKEKQIVISAVFDFVKIAHTERIQFVLNKKFEIKEIKLNGELIKLSRKSFASDSKFSKAYQYTYDGENIEEYLDNKVEIRYTGPLDEVFNNGIILFSLKSFWLPVFEDYPQFMYLVALFIPKDFNLILQGNQIQEEVKEDCKLSFWERDYMDFEIPILLSKELKRSKSSEMYEIYSDYNITDNEMKIVSETTEKIQEFLKTKLKFKSSNSLKLIVSAQKLDVNAKNFCGISKSEIKEFNLDLLKKIIHTMVNISPDISDDNWLVYGLINYLLYLFLEENKGNEVSQMVIEDWKTFLFSIPDPEPILNNIQGKHTDILLNKKAPYIFKMLETVIGRTEFLEQLSDFINKDSFNALPGESFIEFITSNLKPNLENFIHQCLTEREIPTIRINKHLMTDEKGRYKFYGEIIQETNKPFEVPVIFDFEMENGVKERRIHYLKKFKERYEFVFASKPVSYVYNGDSSILVQIRS
ncbi:MAG: hypothetical protein PHV06_06635 [bacterium]|nr:hypothetical protein [bacterium]